MNHHRWHTASGGGVGEHGGHGGGFMYGGVLPGGGFGGPFFGGHNIVQGEILKYQKFITYSTIFADTRNLGISSELVI